MAINIDELKIKLPKIIKAKTIYCPRCGRKVFSYDGKQKINPVGKCKKCQKLVVYNIEKDEVLIKEIPGRTQASGMRFY